MAVERPYYQHLTSSDDLVTPYEAIRAGFVALALEKNRRATPFVAQARALKTSASEAKTPAELINIEDIQPALLTAAGISDKATGHLLTVPLVKNNVDLCLFDCSLATLSPTTYTSPDLYIALGELKGGIDPAGADEHWKTARTALNRIQKAFSNFGLKPHTFFIGAAIEKKMASEIWSQLEDDTLENAANLTDDNQVASVSRRLCSL